MFFVVVLLQSIKVLNMVKLYGKATTNSMHVVIFQTDPLSFCCALCLSLFGAAVHQGAQHGQLYGNAVIIM
jgi:hypothetical protein